MILLEEIFLKNILALDLGASNGKAILGNFTGDKIQLQEVYRFTNEGVDIHEELYWDILNLYTEVKKGICLAENMCENLTSIGIDSWGVDYGFLDKKGKLLGNSYHYRDNRTDKAYKDIFKKMKKDEIYKETGIQFIQINTLVQLFSEKKVRPWIFNEADCFLMIPDLINYFLTGQKYNECTNASTTQLFNPIDEKWSNKVLETIGIPKRWFNEIIYPGEIYGVINNKNAKQMNLSKKYPVYSVASHDTASAVAAIPFSNKSKSAFISNGTWSLLGMELDEPMINRRALESNFTNECGANNTICFLRNIDGLWIIEQCKKSWEKMGLDLNYQDILNSASKAEADLFEIDTNNRRFFNPIDMVEEIKGYCKETNQQIPKNYGQIARGVYESLAKNYFKKIKSLEEIIGTKINTIHMVGGGAKAKLLCELTAKYSGCKVIVGPVEATALGNIIVQLIAQNEIKDIKEGRELIKRSVEFQIYD